MCSMSASITSPSRQADVPDGWVTVTPKIFWPNIPLQRFLFCLFWDVHKSTRFDSQLPDHADMCATAGGASSGSAFFFLRHFRCVIEVQDVERVAWQEEAGHVEGISHPQIKQVVKVPTTQEHRVLSAHVST